ncbi:MAG: CHAT domain-containing protein [Gammaproteobacteria bacterium]
MYPELADLLIGEGRLPEAQQVLNMLKEEEYFDFVRRDAAKADSLATRSALSPHEAEVERRYREIADQLTTLGTERGALLQKTTPTPEEERRLARLDKDLEVAGQKFQAFLKDLPKEFSDVKWAEDTVVKELREARALKSGLRELGAGTVALYTVVSEERYHVILFTPDLQIARQYQIAPAELNRKVLDFRQALQNPKSDPRPLAQALYRILVAPVEGDLRGAQAKTLLWSLDGVLRYLPVAALHDGQAYLAERYRNVVFTPASMVSLKDPPSEVWKALGLGVSQAHEGFDALPSVVDELGGIIRRTGMSEGVLPGEIKLDAAFTKDTMLASLRQRYPVVHIASHFQFHPGDETASFLLLGDGNHLPLAEIDSSAYQFFDGVELLALSACNTATGGAGADGKEIEGFGVLAQHQGAKAVIATLWPVADASTKALMQTFYRLRGETRSETTKAEALRQAQLSLLHGELQDRAPGDTTRSAVLVPEGAAGKDGAALPAYASDPRAPYAHPYYWAPFILIGNSR